MFRTAHCLATLSASVLMTVAAASAGAADLRGPAGDLPSITVKYADLDLHTAQGVAALYHRLTMAAVAVCPVADARHLSYYRMTHECQQAAIARAVNDIGNPTLARVAVDHGVSND